MTFSAARLAFQAYMATPILLRDLDVLIGCGRLQQIAAREGLDTPAGWFAVAARSYPPCDDVNKLARRAFELASLEFDRGVPS